MVGSVQADNMKQEIDRRLIIWNIHRRTIRPTCNLLGVTEHQSYLVSYHGRIEVANMNNTIVTIVCVTILNFFKMQSGAGGHEWPLCIGDYGDAPLISSCRLFLARSDVKSVNSHPPVPSPLLLFRVVAAVGEQVVNRQLSRSLVSPQLELSPLQVP